MSAVGNKVNIEVASSFPLKTEISKTLAYSSELPTVPGYYWYKKYPSWKGIIVKLEQNVDPDDYTLYQDGWQLKYWKMEAQQGKWVGPIEEPPTS